MSSWRTRPGSFKAFYTVRTIRAKSIIGIAVVGLLGIFNMALAYYLGWNPRLVAAAVIAAIVLNIAPLPPAGRAKEEMRTMVDQIYQELSLPHGRAQAKIGVAVFA